MIKLGTNLKVADNTGGKILRCFHIFGGSKRKFASAGDMIEGTVKSAEPRKPVQAHQVVRAVIVRQRKELRRLDGTFVRFGDNACVILEGKTKDPKGGRILGPVAREVREKGFEKVAALAEEIL